MKYFIILAVGLMLTGCGEQPEKQTETAASSVQEKVQKDPLTESVERGKEIYGDLCITCHLPSGKGVPGAFPPLNPSNWLTKKRAESIHAVKYGLKGEIVVNGKPYNSVMLPLGLDDQEVADVMNYTIQTWNKGDMVTVEEVRAVTE
ncbi:c-type cytochrome [Nonlabens marinus]|uniref:Copper-containing nitrite reductase n=1 Tax=Nonlabens marinus S1-08 TaxID=1454201 RepID=W8VT22_9FLAO|nr:c-type cytochrome [Nonlabens marinus]BAO56690.1 copper-containing nitrite reductase [Nonlabens marinus S1-08]